MTPSERPFAVVTGASTGIGFELALCAAHDGCDLLIAADEERIDEAAERLRDEGATVQALCVDLATAAGVERLVAATDGRPVDFLIANAGRGLGHAFLDQPFADIQRVIDTNVMGTVHLIHELGRRMRDRGSGRILITGSIAGFIPGSFQAVYNASKAFVDSFALALRNELKDSGVTVTCLMPGPTDTEFFRRADLLDTKVGQGHKDDPAMVAREGYQAMMKGEADIVTGLRNKLQVAAAHVTPAELLAEQHRKQTAPGTGARAS